MAFNFEKSKSDKEPKGMKEGSKKEEALDKKQMKFAKGGLATTQNNLKTMGRGLARVANQKSGGAMKCGGKVKMKKGGKC